MTVRRKNTSRALYPLAVVMITFGLFRCSSPDSPSLTLEKGDHIVLVGNNLASRMMNFGHFETEVQVRYPDYLLVIRNMGDGGNTPGFRPHSVENRPGRFRVPKNSRRTRP